MISFVYRRYTSGFIKSVFIFLFVYTATAKLADHEKFEVVLNASPLIGSFASWVSWLVPFTEIFIAFLLLRPGTRHMGFAGSFLLMLFFSFYIAWMLLFSPHLPCSCGGIIGQLNWREHLIVNLLLTSLAAFGWFKTRLDKTGDLRLPT